jgi:hypothetical protein
VYVVNAADYHGAAVFDYAVGFDDINHYFHVLFDNGVQIAALCHGGFDMVDYMPDIRRKFSAGTGRGYGAAFAVSDYGNQPGFEVFDRVFNTAQGCFVDNIAGVADGEVIAELLIKVNLRRNARIGAGHDRGKGRLASRKRFSVGRITAFVNQGALEIALISFLEHLQSRIGIRDKFRRLVNFHKLFSETIQRFPDTIQTLANRTGITLVRSYAPTPHRRLHLLKNTAIL